MKLFKNRGQTTGVSLIVVSERAETKLERLYTVFCLIAIGRPLLPTRLCHLVAFPKLPVYTHLEDPYLYCFACYHCVLFCTRTCKICSYLTVKHFSILQSLHCLFCFAKGFVKLVPTIPSNKNNSVLSLNWIPTPSKKVLCVPLFDFDGKTFYCPY